MGVNQKTKEHLLKSIKFLTVISLVYSLFFLSGELFSFHTGGYHFRLSNGEEEFVIENKMTNELVVYPVTDETSESMIRLFITKERLDTQLVFTSIYATILLIGILGIFEPRYRLIKSLTIYLPTYVLTVILIVYLQYNYYFPGIDEINHLIESININESKKTG